MYIVKRRNGDVCWPTYVAAAHLTVMDHAGCWPRARREHDAVMGCTLPLLEIIGHRVKNGYVVKEINVVKN